MKKAISLKQNKNEKRLFDANFENIKKFRLKKLFLTILLIVSCNLILLAQTNYNCSYALQFCSNGISNFPLTTNNGSGQAGPDYTCLYTQPNPTWFYIQVDQPGNIDIKIQSTPGDYDLDFTCWGPFTSLNNCGNLTSTNTVDCSYSTSYIENLNIIGAMHGAYYIFIVTNYSNQATDLNLTQTNLGQSGFGTASCNSNNCVFDSISLNVGNCSQPSNHYNIYGNIITSTIPDTGYFVVRDITSGITQTIYPPFGNISYNLNNLPLTNDTCTVTFQYFGNYYCFSTLNYSPPQLVSTSYSVANPSCGNSDGAIVLNITSGGIPNYSYEWSSGENTLNTPNTTNIINLISSGVYTVTITNGNGCTTSSVVNLTDNVNYSISLLQNSQISCNGSCDASLNVSVVGANLHPPYNFQWNNGNATTNDINFMINNLCAGLNSIYCTDSVGCTVLNYINIIEPTPLSINITNVIPTCYNTFNGSATAITSDGIPPYMYLWNTNPIQTTQTAVNLGAGNYFVLATDSHNCSVSGTVTIVSPPPTNAQFSYTTYGLTATFINSSTSGIYAWNFGNGYNSSVTNPIFTYSNSGVYNVCLLTSDSCGSDSYCTNVSVISLDVESNFTDKVAIFPNPVIDKLNIILKNEMITNYKLNIFNCLGEVVLESEIKNNYKTIDLNDIAQGIYFLQIYNKNEELNTKIQIIK